ncbi:class I SAM-dependent methyltransferase [Chitinilyticum piscinae]|uniref:Class I SAM-dependent methyltransferase n=1 Tax=Chitinilyticum piscinae TaxID=2866724 RepID=A0A8J7K9A3_9NEIS|nr:class I SAM-dependent methyltransferase [Chitinilyticum piscinae]MBE9607774.1 class I SAM-dependent methyltransferase [Chitinilyticum piscinae]
MSRSNLAVSSLLEDYLRRNTLREAPALADLRHETAGHRLAKMQLAPEQGALLTLLLRLIGARRYLEVGTFTGYSSLTAALAMGEDSLVVACDASAEFTRIARQHWEKAGVAHRVELRLQDAMKSLDELLAEGRAGEFDCMFIDADKPAYPAYYERGLQLVRRGGLIILDNMLLGGRVAEPVEGESAGVRVVRQFNRDLRDDDRVECSLLPVGDGLTLLVKR